MNFSLRNISAFFLANIYRVTGLVKFKIQYLLNNEIILSLYTHNPDVKYFESCLKWLIKKGFKFISIIDLDKILNGEIPFPKGAVLITVDDGWKENKQNVIALATKYHVPVTIFVTTEPVISGNAYWWSYIKKANQLGLTKYTVNELKRMKNNDRLQIVNDVKNMMKTNREALNLQELVEASNNEWVSIGSHTVTHPILINCSDKTSFYEIVASKDILGNWLNKQINAFSYPNGDFSSREINYLKKAGYQFAFTTKDDYITPNNIIDLYTLPRTDLIETISFSENICRMTGVWFTQKKQFNKLIK